MTSKKWLSFIISSLQWLLLSVFALAVVVMLFFAVLVYSCHGARDPL